MTTLWITIVGGSLGCYALKLAGVSLPESVLGLAWVKRTAALLPIAMLTALVLTDLFASSHRYRADWPTVIGVGAGAVALRLGRSLVVVFVAAAATTAVIRLLG